MIIVLLGPPGAGKGTQAKKICQSKELFHFSTGDILRNEVKQKSSIGHKIESIINAGKLVSNDIILSIVEKIISEESSENKGILFDGFPRNMDQANLFERLLEKKEKKIDLVLHLQIEKDEIIKRIKKREAEENREDDSIEVLKLRIDVYLQETTPLIDLYKKQNILKTLNGTQSIEDVSNDMNKSFDEIN